MATILDTLVGSCTTKLQEIITEEAILVLEVKEQLKELQRKASIIQCFLADAEKRRMEEPTVEKWLGQLRDVMFDVDDIIDLARFKGSVLLPDHPSSSSGKPTACSGLSLSSCFCNIRTRHEVAVKIRSLNKKIESILKDEVFLTFSRTPSTENGVGWTPEVSSSLVEPNLVGKEIMHACKKVVDLVLQQKERKDYKIAIVGTGGVGKTALAQKIYHDQKIKENFTKKAWICISSEYSKASVLRQVLRSMKIQHEQDESVGELQSKLESDIKDKSFFIVLDDVWQSEAWTNLLRTPLHAASTGIILFTTRHDTVALEIGANYTHRVDLMSMDVGWELLLKSMNINEEKQVQNLRDIGSEIVRKCGGLPLAIRAIATVLASKNQNESEWRKILDENAWSMSNLPKEIQGAIYLSYVALPHHLKQCFLYCAVYPEDETIHRDDIIRMWVAEGFINKQHGQLLEDTAEEYYYELIHRNLLQPDELCFDHSECKMHDLFRQLACHLSREECFVGDPESLDINMMCKLRRITIVTAKDVMALPSIGKDQYKLRTYMTSLGEKPLQVDNSLFKRLTYLRVLDLTGSLVQNISSYIGNLIHLRLLNLSGTDISHLPESIGNLQNLQILNLQRCKSLNSLPWAITRLCNLRRLGLANTPVNQVPKGIGGLKLLNDLEGFPVGARSENVKMQDGWNLEELAHLSQLRRLDMVKLVRGTPFSGTDSFLLTDKQHLKDLVLCCTERADETDEDEDEDEDEDDSSVEAYSEKDARIVETVSEKEASNGEAYSEEDVSNAEKIFEQLKPPRNLESLEVRDFLGQRFPTWLGTAHLSAMKTLDLIDCKYCVHLPPIGQLPNLKYLKISGAAAVTKIGPEWVGYRVGNVESTEVVAFPKLEYLIFGDMPSWEDWFFEEEEKATATAKEGGQDVAAAKQKEEEALSPRSPWLLPCLKELQLLECPKLMALPPQLGQQATSLKELFIRGASCLKTVEDLRFLSGYLEVDGCDSLGRISNLPQVRELLVTDCPNLRHVEELGSLEQLLLDEGMHEISSLWLPRLQEERRRLHGDELDVNEWL